MNVKSQDSKLPCIAFLNFLGKSANDLANNLRVRTKWKGKIMREPQQVCFNSAALSFRPFSGKDKIRLNPQGRLAKKNIFIDAHRFLLVSFAFLSMKRPVVVHFYLIKPLYDIPEELLNIVPHFMIFSKS